MFFFCHIDEFIFPPNGLKSLHDNDKSPFTRSQTALSLVRTAGKYSGLDYYAPVFAELHLKTIQMNR